ncbi:hypothetical protein BOTBODRAFT_181032 [Botryobasidium botryosum FD-172 SS1]|uniref:Shieldin complex subunit 2 first OB fold domain-containing protein n=1 Tax=Botryobasidium botryosum (strain FD-172 SS1) TaxID=930990 RepID=A0A067M597_BOTB1|nr:hypothetical protein BOTBODRAFT_181032 [Botryobasidium botryosum FD-172 SS1]
MARYRVFLGAPKAHIDSAQSTRWHTVPSPAAVSEDRWSSVYEGVLPEPLDEEASLDASELTDASAWSLGKAEWSATYSIPPSTGRWSESDASFRDSYYASGRPEPPPQSQSFSRDESQLSIDSSGDSFGDSIGHFPSFHFSLHALSSLSLIMRYQGSRCTEKVNLLVAALEVGGLDFVKIKNGPDAGLEVGVLKLVVGDDLGGIGRITVWRETAEAWGGQTDGTEAVKRGDIVLLKNILVNHAPPEPTSITASPKLQSNMEICYRTLPQCRSDESLRPDLRLGRVDASVRKVAELVEWVQKLAG